jgi:hypothetical protein
MIGYQDQGYERLMRPLYSFAESDRLAGVTRGTSRRWLKGYTQPRRGRGRPTLPDARRGVIFIDRSIRSIAWRKSLSAR